MASVIVIRGPLGVGKTTVAKLLAATLKAIYFSVDEVLAEHGLDKESPIPVANFIKANKRIVPLADAELMQRKVVIIDGNFYHREAIEHLHINFSVPVIIFTLKASVATCIKRDAARPKPYGEDAVRAVHTLVSAFDTGITLETDKMTADEIVATISAKLESMAYFL